jgi:phenylalanyl-tRNA synthetase beta chain
MRFTLSWLKKFLDTDETLSKIAHTLTHIGLEVEAIHDKGAELSAFTVAEIIEAVQHPDADKLRVCKVQTGHEILQIVCGASNARAGIKVVLASVGAVIPNGNFVIKKSSIRGVESNGMLCSAEELGIDGDHEGIIELPLSANIGEPFAKYFGLDEPVIHINVTPNRADALGVYGIARDLAASGMGKFKELTIPKIEEEFVSDKKLTVKDAAGCPLFAMREIKNISNLESPDWLKALLENIGIGSISPVVDVTNYICYTFGQPMHAYDAQKIHGGLSVETLDGTAKFKALNDKEYELAAGDLVIRDDRQVHCLAGIIGGSESACSDSTTSIILEAASFSGDKIIALGRRLMIDTDSRYRFERNVNLEFTLQALDIATEMILSICGGSASKVIIQGEPKLPERSIEFPVNFLEEKTGLRLTVSEICEILERLGFVCDVSDKMIYLTIPPARYDISIKEDIVEEIARIYGYDKILEVVLPGAEITRTIPKEQRRASDLKRLLASRGYTEVVTWSFMDSDYAKLFGPLKEELHLQNPISSDLDYMRGTIVPNLLKIAGNNMNRSFKDLSLFEVGPVFENASDEVSIISAAGIRTGASCLKNVHGQARLYDVFDIKADLEVLFEACGLPLDRLGLSDKVPNYYHPTRSAVLSLGKNVIGYFGQIHPLILKKFDIDSDVMAFEVNVSNLPFGKEKYGKKPELMTSDYQMISRDYAFVVSPDQPVGEMLSYIKNIDKKLIKSVSLFDIYQGEKIPDNKKSVALSVQIQDDHKTLTEDVIEALHKSIINSTAQKFGASLREG